MEGDIHGFFDHIAFSWIEEHIPMNKRILAKWLRCGFVDQGALYPTTAGVPQGGILTPLTQQTPFPFPLLFPLRPILLLPLGVSMPTTDGTGFPQSSGELE